MGKFGVRLDSRKNAKRWPKGQSSSSNPETTKHRDQASRMFFTDTKGSHGITQDDLRRHDAMQGLQPGFEKLDLTNDEIESNLEGSANSADTFASDYSNCSNVSFNRFLNHFQAKSLLHKEMLAVLSAVTEIIKQNGGTETSTEYFAALMSTLEAVETETSVAATLSLLGMGLKTVPKNVLNAQFGAASKIFLEILKKYATTDEYLILRHCIHCLSILLRSLELAVWSDPYCMQLTDAILSFITYGKPKVRKAAQHGICAVLKGSDIMKVERPPLYHPVSPQIAKHCIVQLQLSSEPGGITSILHVLVLLKDISHHFPKPHLKTICESLLKLMGLKNVLVTSCCLQTFHGLFVSRPSKNILPAERNAQIITALYDYQPPMTDTQPTLAWLTVMQEAHINLAKTALNVCAAILPKLLQQCMQLWLSDRSEIVAGASHTIKTLLQECVTPLCDSDINAQKYATTIEQVIVLMHSSLSYQYLEAWYHILHLIAVLFEITGKTGCPKLLDIVRTLADLHESHSFTSKSDVEYAIGAAIKTMGPEAVLKSISLMVTPEIINVKRGWMLPLLKDCINQSSLAFFMENLYPMAKLAEQKASENTIAGKTYAFLVPQIWAILPTICHNATDVAENFKNVARTLGIALNEKNLKLSIMSALRKLINRAKEVENSGDLVELAKYAKNYLPILLNMYTTQAQGTDEEGQRRAAFETITVYLTVTSEELVNELFDRAFGRLNEPNINAAFIESVHDVIRLLMEYVDMERLHTYYNVCAPGIKDAEKMKEQKKAYRFFEQLCASEKERCKEFVRQNRREIQKVMIQAAAVAQKPCRGARLKCLIHLVNNHPQLEGTKFLEAIVPEAVLYVKEVNTKCRAAAYQLLNCIAEKFLNNEEHLKEYINMIVGGLLGTPQHCTASLLALSSITYHYNGSLGIQTVKEMLEHACTLAVSKTREIVGAALAFIKVYITIMPSPLVATNLKEIMQTLSNMEKDCQLHFRQKVRDLLVKCIRKYGLRTIQALVPPHNVMLQKRLKNINKIEETKKKNREARKAKEDEANEDEEFSAKRRPKSLEEILADSEDEYDEDAENEPKKHKKRTSRKEAWIQEAEENIVDLADPTAARNITTTLPGQLKPHVAAQKTKESTFKTAPDGRLIITDDNQKDDNEDGGKKKKKTLLLHSDSEDDYEENDAQSVATSKLMPQKRKHGGQSDTASVWSQSTSRYQAGGSGIHRPLKKARTEKPPGGDYRAPKASGDVKKKGKPDPYAYVPLTRSSLNKRKKKKNASKLSGIVKAGRKGAAAGTRKFKGTAGL